MDVINKQTYVSNALAVDLDYILQQCRPLWDELKDQSIFITGGTGFIGTWLLETFAWANRVLQLNLNITVLTRNPERFSRKAPHLFHDPSIAYLTGDVKNFVFPCGKFSYVIHGATEADAKLNQEHPQQMLNTIVHGTQQTLKFAGEAQTEKFLLLSSGAVYGKQPPALSHIEEDYAGSPNVLDPQAAYAVGKVVAEHLCVLQAAQQKMAIKIARCFAFVGPYLPLDKHFAIGNFIRDGLQNKTIQINGDGSPYRSYQYASDLIVWLLHILLKGKSCVPYNVGSDDAISIADLAKAVAVNFTNPPAIQIANKPNKNTLSERYIPSVQRAHDELGLTNRVSLQQAISKTIHWHTTHSHQTSYAKAN